MEFLCGLDVAIKETAITPRKAEADAARRAQVKVCKHLGAHA